jgi:hypothetical protein
MLDHAAAAMPARPRRPPRLPGFDHTLAWLRDRAGFIERCRVGYRAEVVEARLLLQPTLLLLAPDAASQLARDHRLVPAEPTLLLRKLLQRGEHRAPGLHAVALRTRQAFVWRGWRLPAHRRVLIACPAQATAPAG